MAIEDWIPIKEAAKLTKQSEKELCRRDPQTGDWRWFPELSRIQPGGPKTRIWFFRSEIEDWIRRAEEQARRRSVTLTPRPLGEDEALIAQLERMGAHTTVKQVRSIKSPAQ